MCANALLELRQALRDGVAVMPLLDGCDGCLLDGVRHIKVRLTNGKVNRILELGSKIKHLTDTRSINGTKFISDEMIGVKHGETFGFRVRD